jgi:ribosome recycling factor
VMAQDDSRAKSDLVQKATDAAISEIDEVLAAKEREIMQV